MAGQQINGQTLAGASGRGRHARDSIQRTDGREGWVGLTLRAVWTDRATGWVVRHGCADRRDADVDGTDWVKSKRGKRTDSFETWASCPSILGNFSGERMGLTTWLMGVCGTSVCYIGPNVCYVCLFVCYARMPLSQVRHTCVAHCFVGLCLFPYVRSGCNKKAKKE